MGATDCALSPQLASYKRCNVCVIVVHKAMCRNAPVVLSWRWSLSELSEGMVPPSAFERGVTQVNDRDRFDKFTERARKVLSLAQEEAQRFNHNYIGTEHLLLGLVREGEGVAAK